MILKGHKFFNRAIIKMSELKRAEKELNLEFLMKNSQIRIGREIFMNSFNHMAELTESVEQGIIKSMQEQGITNE